MIEVRFPHRQEQLSTANNRRSGIVFCLFSEVTHGRS